MIDVFFNIIESLLLKECNKNTNEDCKHQINEMISEGGPCYEKDESSFKTKSQENQDITGY